PRIGAEKFDSKVISGNLNVSLRFSLCAWFSAPLRLCVRCSYSVVATCTDRLDGLTSSRVATIETDMALIDRFQLTDKVAVITGGGRGIGQGIALAFAEMGAHVVCAARTEKEIAATAERARAFGVRALPLHCDVTDAAQLEAVVATTMKELGRIDLLVNNAG